ncbi:MAG: NAD(P)-dependent oxidoreductase [Verrucomicrobia bacterium]|nr:NAD(P)-dependent oxidoreductase [Verrucomicrobiota bacterium]
MTANRAGDDGQTSKGASVGLPDRIQTEAELDQALTQPSPALVEFIRHVSSPLLIVGAGGKMGPTLSVLARRAAEAAGHRLEVIAVSRFREPGCQDWLEARGVRTLNCDLLESEAVRQLPETANLIYLAGLKFGTAQNPAATWTINTLVPARVAERYPGARSVALATGNVYPMSPVSRGGSVEEDALTPLGEYANSAVARERIFEYYSQRHGTTLALLRLFYAVELRYGVLVDLALKVQGGQPIDLTNGHFNCIWQGEANELVLRALSLAGSPPSVWNLCWPKVFSVRDMARRLGDRLGRAPRWVGSEAETALLGNPAKLVAALRPSDLSVDLVLDWVAGWISRGGRVLGRPTHFEVRDGKY